MEELASLSVFVSDSYGLEMFCFSFGSVSVFSCSVFASVLDFRWALSKPLPCNPVILVSLIRFGLLNEDLPLKKNMLE